MKQIEFERAQTLPKYYASKLKAMSKDLADSYKKEQQMLGIIDRRDREVARLKSELKAADKLIKKTDNYEQRYHALANSRLGKLQVRYWLTRSALRKNG